MSPAYTLVESAQSLEELVRILDCASECALDTEADSMHHYHVRLCLIQITCQGRHWIVDPLCGLNLDSLWKTKAMKSLILHGADYDLRMLNNFYHYRPERVFDTMIAAKFLGEERIGLGHLVEKYFGVTLSKGNQKADWTIRPLPEDMKKYAALDTFYLTELRQILEDQLKAKGRESWAAETCQQILNNSQDEHFLEVDPEAWRIKGSLKLHPRELAYLKQIWTWREAQAEALDRPPYKVLNADALLDLACTAAYVAPNFSLDRLPRLPRNFTGNRLDSLMDALHSAARLSDEECPPREKLLKKRPPSPDSNLLEEIRIIRDRIAEKIGIDSSMLANRHQLVALSMNADWQEKRQKAQLMNWQWELLAPEIQS